MARFRHRLPFLLLALTITLGYGKNHAPDKAVDYNQSAFFWASRKVTKADCATFIFDNPRVSTGGFFIDKRITLKEGKAVAAG